MKKQFEKRASESNTLGGCTKCISRATNYVNLRVQWDLYMGHFSVNPWK